MFRAKQNAIEAWRQVVEVLFAVCPVDILPLEVKYTAIIDILGELNQKVGGNNCKSHWKIAVSKIWLISFILFKTNVVMIEDIVPVKTGIPVFCVHAQFFSGVFFWWYRKEVVKQML